MLQVTTFLFGFWAHQQQRVKRNLVLQLYRAVVITTFSPLCVSTVENRLNHINKMSSASHTDGEPNSSASSLHKDLSIHAAHISEVHNVPMRVLTRPIPSVLDEHKVLSLMETIRVRI